MPEQSDSNSTSLSTKRGTMIVSLLCATILLLSLSHLLVPGAVWITDNGNKYLQMRNFLDSGTLSMQHPEPEFFPTGGFHFVRHRGAIRSFYPEFLSLITAPFYSIFGERGIIFWPMLATIMLMFCSYRQWKNHILPWYMLLCTPLLFYSLLMWEMNVSTLLTCCGLWLIFSRKPNNFCAGIIIGLGLYMREEGYFVLSAIGLLFVVQRRYKDLFALAIGSVIPIIPLWIYQYAQYSHILGLHGGRYYLNNAQPETITQQLYGVLFNYWHHGFRFETLGKWSNLAISPLFIMIIMGAWRSWNVGKTIVSMLSILALCALSIGLWFQHSPEYTAAVTACLVTSTPIAIGFFLNWRNLLNSCSANTSNITRFIIIYLIAVPPLLTRADIGLIWGPRHFLCILPFLFYLSVKSFHQMKIKKLFPIFAFLSISIQVYGFYALFASSSNSNQLEKIIINAPGKTVVSDVFFLPELTPRAFFAKTWYDAHNIPKLITTLKKNKVKEFTLILSPHFRRLKDDDLKTLLSAAPLQAPPQTMHPNSKTIWQLHIAHCRFK